MRIVIPSHHNYGRIDHDYIAQYTCLASDNEFIPVFTLPQGELISNSKTKDFIYNLPSNLSINGLSKFSDFCDRLQRDTNYTYKLTHANMTRTYYSSNNRIIHYDEDNGILIPLMLMCVKAKYLFSVNRDNPDPSQFCLVINRKFEDDEEYFKLYRNVKKHYIEEMSQVVDVLYTNDIMKICFNHKVIKLPKFKTVPEMLNHTKDINRILEVELQENNN